MKKLIFSIVSVSLILNAALQNSALYSTPSRAKVLFASLLIPGGGEYLLGNKKAALGFFIAEGLVWTGYLSMRWKGNSIQNNYRIYASDIAGAYYSERNETYWDAIEWYQSAESYNLKVREDARKLYPDDYDAQLRYIQENSYTGSYAWDWNGKLSQYDYYRGMRRNSREALQNASYILSGAILTRVVSFAWSFNSLRRISNERVILPEIDFDSESYKIGISITGLYR
ncbi:hypothetical protein JXL83_08815 [candidate division WOR-3 bacterium]|nr:hypothetical protein [candidate division WOR-3 bacterium]